MARFEKAPRARERGLLLLLACAPIAACNLIAGLGQFQDVACDDADGCDAGGIGPDALPSFPAEASAFPDAYDDGAYTDDAVYDAAPDGGEDAGPSLPDAEAGASTSEGGVSALLQWPLWRMPNGAEAGLPNPAEYVPIQGVGVRDSVTGLVWGGFQTAVTSSDAAAAACAPPFRLPTRIELVSVLDTSRPSPPLVSPSFLPISAAVVWTSSKAGSGFWTIDFGGGRVSPTTPGNAALCVEALDGGAP